MGRDYKLHKSKSSLWEAARCPQESESQVSQVNQVNPIIYLQSIKNSCASRLCDTDRCNFARVSFSHRRSTFHVPPSTHPVSQVSQASQSNRSTSSLLCTLYSALSTLHSPLCTLHSLLSTLHSALCTYLSCITRNFFVLLRLRLWAMRSYIGSCMTWVAWSCRRGSLFRSTMCRMSCARWRRPR